MKRWLSIVGPFLGLAGVLLLFTALRAASLGWSQQDFLTANNMATVAVQTVFVALGAIGMTFVVVSGGIDLSVGSAAALAAVVTARFAAAGQPVLVAAMAGVLTGAAVGAGNGLLITRLSVVPFITTLGTMGMARGLGKYLANESMVNADPGWLPELMSRFPKPSWLVLAPAVWLVLLLGLLLSVVLQRTLFGLHTYAIGSNESNARLCGVRVERTKAWIYLLCGALSGLAGVLYFARTEVGDPMAASGLELQVVAAVVIGGGSLAGGEGTIRGSLAGAFLMAVLHNGCTLVGVANCVHEILVGAIIVVAVALDRWRR
ncbi:MAG TPA: ABC transporter permease [Planctomycetota bacterium]|nr:ABC transporter permease [Planctomycetota bacterium]